jgi:hypothetical protein
MEMVMEMERGNEGNEGNEGIFMEMHFHGSEARRLLSSRGGATAGQMHKIL